MSKGLLTKGFFECGGVQVEGKETTAAKICDASQSAPAAAPNVIAGGPAAPKR